MSSQSSAIFLHRHTLTQVFLCADDNNLTLFDFSEPPQFVLKLPTTTFVKQCEGHRFECKAVASQSLTMCWFKNDQKITDGGNYKTMFVDSTAYLQLLSTKFEDNGVYTCEARNDAGSASCSTVLKVQGQLSWLHFVLRICSLRTCVA